MGDIADGRDQVEFGVEQLRLSTGGRLFSTASSSFRGTRGRARTVPGSLHLRIAFSCSSLPREYSMSLSAVQTDMLPTLVWVTDTLRGLFDPISASSSESAAQQSPCTRRAFGSSPPAVWLIHLKELRCTAAHLAVIGLRFLLVYLNIRGRGYFAIDARFHTGPGNVYRRSSSPGQLNNCSRTISTVSVDAACVSSFRRQYGLNAESLRTWCTCRHRLHRRDLHQVSRVSESTTITRFFISTSTRRSRQSRTLLSSASHRFQCMYLNVSHPLTLALSHLCSLGALERAVQRAHVELPAAQQDALLDYLGSHFTTSAALCSLRLSGAHCSRQVRILAATLSSDYPPHHAFIILFTFLPCVLWDRPSHVVVSNLRPWPDHSHYLQESASPCLPVHFSQLVQILMDTCLASANH